MSQGYQPKPSNKTGEISNPPRNPNSNGLKYGLKGITDFFLALAKSKIITIDIPKPKYLGSSKGDRPIFELLGVNDLAKIFTKEWVMATMNDNPIIYPTPKPFDNMHQYASVLLAMRIVKTEHLTFFSLVAHFKWQLKTLPNQSYTGHLTILAETLRTAHTIKDTMVLSLMLSSLQAENEVD